MTPEDEKWAEAVLGDVSKLSLHDAHVLKLVRMAPNDAHVDPEIADLRAEPWTPHEVHDEVRSAVQVLDAVVRAYQPIRRDHEAPAQSSG